MKIIPLGTNGFFPSYGRHTACFLVPYGKTLIILDAGTGLFRLGEDKAPVKLADYKYVDIFLSHYHLDHTAGFYAAFKILKGKSVRVFSLVKRRVFEDLTRIGYFPIDYQKEYANFEFINAVKFQDKKEKGEYSFRTILQDHRGTDSLGFRFDFGLSYLTDTSLTEEGTEFVRGSKLLLHEHSSNGGVSGKFNTKDLSVHVVDGHVTTTGAALCARLSNSEKLILIHHNPFKTVEELEKQLQTAKKIFKLSFLALDLKPLYF